MRKIKKLGDSKVSKTKNYVKHELQKKKCENCSSKYMGTKYQKWCAICRKLLSNIEWDWHT